MIQTGLRDDGRDTAQQHGRNARFVRTRLRCGVEGPAARMVSQSVGSGVVGILVESGEKVVRSGESSLIMDGRLTTLVA